MKVNLTATQQEALSLDDPPMLAAHGLVEAGPGAYEATPENWKRLRDEALFFATDYAEQSFGHPFAASLRGLARKIETALRREASR